MVCHFLLSPMKHHRKNCRYDYQMRVRIATAFGILFFSGLAVYLTERHLFLIPLPVAVLLVCLLFWYLADTFFDLAALDHHDDC